MRTLIVVTHLLGTGHLRRSINLARAFVQACHSVTLVSGGALVSQFDTSGIKLVQLPPVCSDGVNFTQLHTPDGQIVTRHDLETRQSMLESAVHEFQPDVVITELFPFGRRVLREEFLALLDAATSLPQKPVIMTSIRDILVPPSTVAKAQQTDDIIEEYYDAVLVHSEQTTTPLEKSWPVSPLLVKKLHYTGYVAQPMTETISSMDGHKEVIVSAGGGSVGSHLFETAIQAAQLDQDTQWRILVGGTEVQSEVKRLKTLTNGTTVIVEAARRDFRQLLQRAACSVSLCGYNTATDLLQTDTPAVLVPFDEGGEVEQRIRAESLALLPGWSMLLASDLIAESLIDAVSAVRKSGRGMRSDIRFDGAGNTVVFASQMLQAKQRK